MASHDWRWSSKYNDDACLNRNDYSLTLVPPRSWFSDKFLPTKSPDSKKTFRRKCRTQFWCSGGVNGTIWNNLPTKLAFSIFAITVRIIGTDNDIPWLLKSSGKFKPNPNSHTHIRPSLKICCTWQNGHQRWCAFGNVNWTPDKSIKEWSPEDIVSKTGLQKYSWTRMRLNKCTHLFTRVVNSAHTVSLGAAPHLLTLIHTHVRTD